jgi:hypothetical protein
MYLSLRVPTSFLAASSSTILVAHPKHPPVHVATVLKEEGVIGGGNGDNKVTHIAREDEWQDG